MKGSHSRLLQVVVAAMLLNVAPDGQANTYNLDPVHATYPDDYDEPTWYYDGNYDDWFSDDYDERSGSSGDDEPEAPDDPDVLDTEKQAECDAIALKVSSTCDLANPPVLTTNGCGSGVSTHLVPDYLYVNGAPIMRLGPIFTGACNLHDICYGTYGSDKESCDTALHSKMISNAKLGMTDFQWGIYGPYAKLQALGYSAGLQAPFISYFSGNAFDSAQLSGACRFYSKVANNKGCLD